MFRLLFFTLLARGQNVADNGGLDRSGFTPQLLASADNCGYEFFEWSDCMYGYTMDWQTGNPMPGNKTVPMKRRALKKSNSAEKSFMCRCTGTCNCPGDATGTQKCSILGYEWSRDQVTFADSESTSQKACSAEEIAALENPASEKCEYTFASEPKKKCQDDDEDKTSETCKKLITASQDDPKWLTCINFNVNGSTSYKQAFPITETKRGKAKGDCVGADNSFPYDKTQCEEIQYTGKCWLKDSEILEPVMNGTPRNKSFDDADCTPPAMTHDADKNCEYTYSEQPFAECVSFVSRTNFPEAPGMSVSGFASTSKDAQGNVMPTDTAFYKVHSIIAVTRKDPLKRGSCDALNRANWGGSLRINNEGTCTFAKTQQSHDAMKVLMGGNVPAQADVQSLDDQVPQGPQLTPQ